MSRASGKNTGPIKKRAGLAPEIASIPRAFGYNRQFLAESRWPNCSWLGLLLPVLVERLRHFKMVLQRRQGLTRPVLQLGIFTAVRIALKQ